PEIVFPFDSNSIVTCDQGPHMPCEESHSHAYYNAIDALDLRTSHSGEPGKIYAGSAGIVSVFDSCLTENDDCGAGFGNQVKVFSRDNTFILYAHLDRVFVKNGQQIKAGDLIGLEGNTGLTGKENRHLHLSVHSGWKAMGLEYWSQTGFLSRSIPFQFKVRDQVFDSFGIQTLSTKTIKCIRKFNSHFMDAALRGLL
ncbi:MAG: M23 family metallopeptidase, partial [Bacteriovoracaceae bacterium]|nr:M23 family metallopeptidase [Bacteriovoracaceae bacterium]